MQLYIRRHRGAPAPRAPMVLMPMSSFSLILNLATQTTICVRGVWLTRLKQLWADDSLHRGLTHCFLEFAVPIQRRWIPGKAGSEAPVWRWCMPHCYHQTCRQLLHLELCPMSESVEILLCRVNSVAHCFPAYNLVPYRGTVRETIRPLQLNILFLGPDWPHFQGKIFNFEVRGRI